MPSFRLQSLDLNWYLFFKQQFINHVTKHFKFPLQDKAQGAFKMILSTLTQKDFYHQFFFS